jgi:hypothetical protein
VWKIGNHGIELGRDELEQSEKMVVVGAGGDAATERNIGWMGSMSQADGIWATASEGGSAPGSGTACYMRGQIVLTLRVIYD